MKNEELPRQRLSDVQTHRVGDATGEWQTPRKTRRPAKPRPVNFKPEMAVPATPPSDTIKSETAPHSAHAPPVEPPAEAPLHPLVAPHHAWLQTRGELWVRSGRVSSSDTDICFHTDYGPLWQDKPTNQDYALVWKGERAGVPTFGIAIGDGLTSSYRSELASQAACSAALHTLVAEMPTGGSRVAVESAVAAALQAVKALAGELALNPERSCPPGQFLATWKYILRQGLFLQTTLTLAWLEDDRLSVGVVGDGGCLVHAVNLAELRIVAQPDLATQEVNALGPGDSGPIPLDHYFEERLKRPFSAVFYSDGVGRGEAPARLIESLASPTLMARKNPAHTFISDAIAGAIEHHSHAFDDNLTIAILRASARWRP